MAAILKKKSWYRDYLLIFLGTALMSVALNSAFEPNGLVDGGFSGIAIIIKNIIFRRFLIWGYSDTIIVEVSLRKCFWEESFRRVSLG